jgi:hypothetical protein
MGVNPFLLMSYEDPMIRIIEKRIEAIEALVSSLQNQINEIRFNFIDENS